jgi:hypothetical protein
MMLAETQTKPPDLAANPTSPEAKVWFNDTNKARKDARKADSAARAIYVEAI